VFEEHLPETVRLPRLAVHEGELVALKRESGNQLWQIKSIRTDTAIGIGAHPQDPLLAVVVNFDPGIPRRSFEFF